MNFLFVELPVFTKLRPSYLNEEQYRKLQQVLLRIPDKGDLIQNTGGLRKLRFSDLRRQKGKRGGLRIIYFWWKKEHQIWLFTIYNKGEVSDLTSSEKNILQQLLKNEIRSREKSG